MTKVEIIFPIPIAYQILPRRIKNDRKIYLTLLLKWYIMGVNSRNSVPPPFKGWERRKETAYFTTRGERP